MTEEEIVERARRHVVRKDRRAKFLSRLTPHQRKVRDSHIAWVRWWRKEYAELVVAITDNKKFIRKQGHNNVASLKLATRRLDARKRKARGMILARMASKVDYAMKIEQPAPKQKVKTA